MQSRRNQRTRDLSKPALPSVRAQSAREAVLRVTQELLQSHASSGHEVSNQNITEQKTRLLGAIQPVLDVVADSALRHSDSPEVQQ